MNGYPIPASTSEGAAEALNRALNSLERGDMKVAALWSDIASETIRLTPRQQVALVAPADGPNKGDVAVILIVGLILLWLVADTVLGLMS
jgi:hypothetical protein